AYTDRALVPASNACRPAGSVGRRPTNFFLAGAAWLEGSVFSDLQISNLKSAVRLGWQSGTGQQTTFSSWSISACDPSRCTATTVECAVRRNVPNRASTSSPGGSAREHVDKAIGSPWHQRVGASQRRKARNQRTERTVGRLVRPQCVIIA